MGAKIKQVPIFGHVFDDTAVEIRKLDDECYIWTQYGPTEGGMAIDKLTTYTKSQIIDMLDFMEGLGESITAKELFLKFDKMETNGKEFE